jgi:predicted enzyme related to lactoylglutathione lyase
MAKEVNRSILAHSHDRRSCLLRFDGQRGHHRALDSLWFRTSIEGYSTLQRSFLNILSENVDATAAFYERLLNMERHFDSDWFVILTHAGIKDLEYGILQRDHDIVPEGVRAKPAGVIVTFVVSDCDKVYKQAVEMGADIVQPPTNMPYGQRRMLARDPEGTLIDISAPTAPVQQA